MNVVKKIKDSFSPKYFALIYAAAPLIKKRDLVRSIEFLKNSKKAERTSALVIFFIMIFVCA